MNRFRQQDNLLGQSNSFLEVLEHVSQVASLHKPVMIIGERGTGKELIAARLHYLSKRWDQSYVKLNCAALSENLLESELFGHESGAFTGASKRHEGRFERADGGSLFLDELANTSGLIQEKLLRVIEYGEFERVGGKSTIKVDTRLICATNEDLPTLAEKGEFRSDLLDRLAFDVITLPPLRERKEDILLLSENFAINMARDLEWELFSGFTRSAQETLLDYPWPGNIRELKNTVERSVYRSANAHIPVHNIILDPFKSPYRPISRVKTHDRVVNTDLHEQKSDDASSKTIPSNISNSRFPCDLKTLSNQFEIDLINKALKNSQFNQKKTAEMLGLTYHQLRGYLKKYNLLESTQ
ncbi:phage shock protein operon transcriptional activator [Pseudoalteromonas sp. NBT06-2]|uniref:phage shock protein operon transcriptional activator n=1 Tax=Pseudoalteromonas sp. NBT06-2 TaxID=2025950 RepID=UPI000BA531F3|nr:phage shock protein operon transcriptional activator [Pseudoalteromonas sp. NBT06-2]PAJ73148.1 phage shock protein operon transcriptional activator [Pseudoalteromonas sp. NBT06-2]